jgi:hypothetical protein
MSDDQTWNGGIPGWAKAVAAVGIPGVIALALVWMIGKEIPNIIRMGQQNHALMVQIREAQAEGGRMLREQNANAEAMYRLQQRICANTAKNDSDQRACFEK